MSDNFKTISRAKKTIEHLLDQGWYKTKLMKEIGITHKLYGEIMEDDPVSIKILNPSVVKLKEFIAKHEPMMIPQPESKVTVAKKEPEPEPTRTMEEVKEELRKHQMNAQIVKMHSEKDLLTELTELCNRFSAKGYRLDVAISRIYQPTG